MGKRRRGITRQPSRQFVRVKFTAMKGSISPPVLYGILENSLLGGDVVIEHRVRNVVARVDTVFVHPKGLVIRSPILGSVLINILLSFGMSTVEDVGRDVRGR